MIFAGLPDTIFLLDSTEFKTTLPSPMRLRSFIRTLGPIEQLEAIQTLFPTLIDKFFFNFVLVDPCVQN